jgi:hypothetical protein
MAVITSPALSQPVTVPAAALPGKLLGLYHYQQGTYYLKAAMSAGALVMVRFGSVQFRGYFARTPNQTIGSVQGFSRTLN